jgi:hypothetical protein
MNDSREEQIRQELLRSPLPSYKEINEKYRISYASIARLRREVGVPRYARAPRRPRDRVREIQWMWRQVKELRIALRDALRRMDTMSSLLNNITETIGRLRPYEPWVRYYTEGAPGYGSLSLFIAERSGVDLETLRSRFQEAGDSYHCLLSIIEDTD